MTQLVTDDLNGTSCEATGHPSSCTEPVPGTVQGTSHSVTINNANGDEKPIATRASTLHFDSHAHSYTDTDNDGNKECTDMQSHDLSGGDFNSANLSSSLNINGEPVIVVANDVATDPGSNSPVNTTGTGINNTLNET